MSYESRIGWRYLYRGELDRRHLYGLAIFAAMTALGLGMALATDGGSGWGIILTGVGMMGAVLFGLLWVFSVFTTVSVLGVVLGVAAMTLVLAVTSGFQQQFQDKVLGVNAHVIIMKNNHGFSEYREIEEMAWKIDSDVIAVQPFIFVEMQVTQGQGHVAGVAIKGIDPKRMNSVLDVHKHVVEGSAESLGREQDEDAAPPIIMGQVLAEKLKTKIGDKVTVVVPPIRKIDTSDWQSLSDSMQSIEFEVTGIFYSGFAEYDQRLMYAGLSDMQKLLDFGDKVMGVELKLRDVSRGAEIANKLDKQLGGVPWSVQDWHELNRNLFTALTLQKIALVIVLTLIMAVAIFNMVSALTMMVIDKTREIAILRSMGSSSIGIGRVFQTVGLSIGGVGTVCGLTIGLTLCELLQRYNYRLDPKVYLIDRLPVSVDLREVLMVGAGTMVISAVATWFPSSKASALSPVDGLRYD
ncbi:MAG: ABC transporter permease [Myxococcales bacterium]|nr:ABC transporter permease [Myxococcales bacterium]